VLTASQIVRCLWAEGQGTIHHRSLRVYFACVEAHAIRRAAGLRKSKRHGEHFSPRFGVREVAQLTGLTERLVRRELKRLEAAALLAFTPTEITFDNSVQMDGEGMTFAASLAGKRSLSRPVPVPRRMVRYLAACRRPAVTKTILAYALRGLVIERRTGAVRGVGAVKASWIAEHLGLSLRAVKSARRVLIELGWITRDVGSVQRKLNRDGAYFTINLAWDGSLPAPRILGVETATPLGRADSAPPAAQTCSVSAPPSERQETYFVSKNQKPSAPPKSGTGDLQKEREPDLRDVKAIDLEAFSRTEALYEQAVAAGIVERSDASYLNWFAAAVRAKTTSAGDPVRLFLGIVRKRLWHHITQEQEDRARRAIVRYRCGRAPSLPVELLCAA
jgi:hypothetical protein